VSALESRYWFPAKRYGWGWGPPRTWQGWLVLAVFFALLAVGALVFLPKQQPGSFVIYTAFLVVVLIAVCYFTGEPPRWRWGEKSNN
jgi:drug/metabolite transporter (DMT)-like permease